ncbi:MAG TPA: DEAD/DEAH box helicase family protein [Anaerolineae bacterium]|nr:DEAD/DEAH box helicase family protein [Anaerolineae bacterium]
MPRKQKSDADQISLLELTLKTAPCVPAIRQAVRDWREAHYKGATATTKTLLAYWFRTDHRLPNGLKFTYYPFQREAVETLIFLYEVAQTRRYKTLIETYAQAVGGQLRLLQYDDFARYCLKMATGSGKTKVIALAVAWQYFNAVLEDAAVYAKTSLLIAPNVIVFERLKTDFAGGRIFKVDPVIPPELTLYWDMACYMRGDAERAHSEGALYLTNIQQLYERADAAADEVEIMTQMLGPKPPAQTQEVEDFAPRILARGGPLFIANDEAHHTHDEENEWSKTIRRLHTAGGVNIQLDMSATPRYSKGSLFTWTVFDYPLKQAILDAIVKRPLKGVTKRIREKPSDIASTRYQAYLTAGVERWREYRDQLTKLDRKPVLFVMMSSTAEADDVADYLRTKYPGDFAGDQLLVIHTNRSGDIAIKDEAAARKAAQEIDAAKSPINAIVSVLMLREGWDVQSVTVIVGLRPYSAKANILPEQTVGRGLRLMFRGNTPGNALFRETVDVIGNEAFIEFVEQLERDEEMAFETFDLDKDHVVIETIFPDPAKIAYDITLPVLSPHLARKRTMTEEIAALNVAAFKTPKLPKKQGDASAEDFTYEGYDIITLERKIEREYTIPDVQTAQEVISYYAKRIANDLKLPTHFAPLVPKVREFLEHYAFGERVALDDPAIVKAIAHPVAQHVTLKAFLAALREAIIEEQTPMLEHSGRPLSLTPGFPWSRPTAQATKTVFNLVAADNEFEKAFALFLEKAPDVTRFAKLPANFGFSIPYTDTAANLRYYEPDFVAVTGDGVHHLIETKGRVDVDVAHKNRAAYLWCENATMLTGTPWDFKIIHQPEYESLHPQDFEDLIALEPVGIA